ncbi:MAG: hypothetical protein ACREQY_06795 [Candidatus Binatia bacterium]
MTPGADNGTRTPGRRPRLSFYRRLSRAQKQEYDRSDAITAVPLRPSPALAESANAVVAALEGGRPEVVRRAAQDLVDRICAAVTRRRLARPHIRVLRTRPRFADGEFHGLYTRSGRGECEIKVWMLTAAHRQVVKPRTFLRTLLHEVVHHFDMALLDLPSSFHTIGFHARESSLLRALERSGAEIPNTRAAPASARELPATATRDRAAKDRPRAAAATPKRKRRTPPAQLDLFSES